MYGEWLPDVSSPSMVISGLIFFTIIIWFVYCRLLPRPIPGIPYHKQSASRILGDIPDAGKWRHETGEIWSFVRQRALDLNSPIFQMFMRGPFGKPWVVITDFREALDIQTIRQGEFDRSQFLGNVFRPVMPGNHVWMASNNQFRANRSLIKDTMAPSFLHNVAGPTIHLIILDLLDLWREKSRLANGRPFEVGNDLVRGMVDVILAASLGIQTGMSKSQAELLGSLCNVDLPSDVDDPVVFAKVPEHRDYTEIRTLVDSIQIGMASPMPKQHMNFALRFYPSLVTARKYTSNLMTDVLRKAWDKFANGHDQKSDVSSAVDLLMQREAQMANKESRNVKYNTNIIRDELLGFYLAGHETTSTTLCWALKHLTHHQEIQTKLRSALEQGHRQAAEKDRLPTAEEIISTSIPYLDAFIEENHRFGCTIPTQIRRTTQDAIVLGHSIPEGTDVFLMVNGPSIQSPAFPVDENVRSQTSRDTKSRYGTWQDSDIGHFKPERWLITNDNGELKFNPFSGPVLPYGAGLRGCFGIKLAVIELRILVTLLVWSFKMNNTPANLSSFQAHDVNTHRARQTYLRLSEVER